METPGTFHGKKTQASSPVPHSAASLRLRLRRPSYSRLRPPSAAARRAGPCGPARPGEKSSSRWVFALGAIWLWVKTNGTTFGVGEFTTHVRTYFSGDWDVQWGYERPRSEELTCHPSFAREIKADHTRTETILSFWPSLELPNVASL